MDIVFHLHSLPWSLKTQDWKGHQVMLAKQILPETESDSHELLNLMIFRVTFESPEF